MKVHEFFSKYANVPLSLRHTPISYKDGGNMTLSDVYKRMNELEAKMSYLRIEEEKLLKLSGLVLEKL